jgi:hypothetical protein
MTSIAWQASWIPGGQNYASFLKTIGVIIDLGHN